MFPDFLSPPIAAPRRPTPKSPSSPWPPLLWGAALGAAGVFLPFFGFFARALTVAVHEALGHSVAYWFFASPSIPAPNFFGETGHAIHFGYSTVTYVLWLVAWAWLWAFSPIRPHPFVKLGVPVLAALQAVLVFSGAAEPFGVAAGHGAEAFWAFVIALWAAGKRHETPVTPFLASLAAGALAAALAAMCAKILWSPDYRDFYLANNAGMNDLVRLAGVSKLSTIAAWYLAAALASVPGGFFLGRRWAKFRG